MYLKMYVSFSSLSPFLHGKITLVVGLASFDGIPLQSEVYSEKEFNLSGANSLKG